jgi:hypothetical protein
MHNGIEAIMQHSTHLGQELCSRHSRRVMPGFDPRFGGTAVTPDAEQRSFKWRTLGADGLSEQTRN